MHVEKKKMGLLGLVLCLAVFFGSTAGAMDGGMPPDMPPGDMGNMGGDMNGGGGDGAPTTAAIVITDGAENTEAEYVPGSYSDRITTAGGVTTIGGLELESGDYTFQGISVTGPDSVVRLQKSTIRLGVETPATDGDTGGSAVSIGNGATVYISDSDLTVDGAGRYVTANYQDGTLVVNSSTVTSTGSNDNTQEVSEPFSNEALLISGTARANFSVGVSKTYYFHSVCTAEGWAALSTDSATGDGLDLYAYNTEAIAEHGGYGTYADTNCRVWLYGSRLTAAEIGCIISKSGQIHAYGSSAADETLLSYNEGEMVDLDTSIVGGRNAVMIHAPDMMGEGLMAADCGILTAEHTTLATSNDLVSTKDYRDYGDAVGAYVDYISGSVILVRSTSAKIDLNQVQMDSYSGTLVQSVLSADSMGNFLAPGDGDQVEPISVTMTDMDVVGDIRHEDYQRRMRVTLENTTLSGNIVSGTMEDWNSTWSDYADVNWVVDDSFDATYGVSLTLGDGAVWNVTGESSLRELTVAAGATINGDITLDGERLSPEPGETYTGEILVSGDYDPNPQELETSTLEEQSQEPETSQTPEVTPETEQPQEEAAPETTETAPEEGSGSGAAIPAVAGILVLLPAILLVRKKKH
jgi:hypothetical protein